MPSLSLKNRIKATVLAITMYGCFSPQLVFATDQFLKDVPNAEIVGKGRLSVFVWDVYDAVLYAPNGFMQEGAPFALSLTYLRNVSGRDIADTSVEEIRKLGFKDEVRLATWHNQMRNIFPDVAEGSNITGVYTQNGTSIFYQKGTEIGQMTDPEFGKYFFDIWLHENTSNPELRNSLLGSL